MVDNSEYGQVCESLRSQLSKTIDSYTACTIALSGGLDSSIIAALRAQRTDTRCISIVSSDFGASDMTYSQTIARKAGLQLDIINVNIDEILDGVDKTIKVLGNFNPIEIRNATVIYLALCAARNVDSELMITGDGADELFGGYSFLVNAPAGQLRSKLDRLQRIMHFPSIRLAESVNLKTTSPYLSDDLIALSHKIPDDLLVQDSGDGKIGKWILRKTFENDISPKIAWRQKVPMSQGSGLDGIGEFLERIIPDSVFNEQTSDILERDGVRIRNKESLHYYKIFKKECDVLLRAPDGAPSCPDCHSDVSANDGRFCRMCGRFPV